MLLEQKNLQGILKNEMHSIFQIALCHYFSCDTRWVPNGYHEIFIKKIVDSYAM